MASEIVWKDFLRLRSMMPLVDVRTPKEFAEGHIPGAINIPLLNDIERETVGTLYKQRGRLEAIKAGFRLVGPRLSEIIDRTLSVVEANELLIHCWRGGMRSSNFSQFVGMAGVKTHVLRGGYKNYRQQAAESFARPFKLILISGCTGSGKTEVLRALQQKGEQVLDLEGMANHKGSAFGGLMMPPQPSTEQFQNYLFEQLLTVDINRPVWAEDESVAIGKIFIPNEFWNTMRRSPVVTLDVNKEIRIQRLVNEYGQLDKADFLKAMSRITRKLGGQHFNNACEKLEQNEMHAVMEILLTYYDKAYLGSMEKRNPVNIGKMEWDGADSSHAAEYLIRIGEKEMTTSIS